MQSDLTIQPLDQDGLVLDHDACGLQTKFFSQLDCQVLNYLFETLPTHSDCECANDLSHHGWIIDSLISISILYEQTALIIIL